jgi:beta-aspartyl-peptidase (threonine type)
MRGWIVWVGFLALMVGCSVHSGSPDIKWALVLHGGAGTIERSLMTKEREAEYRAALSAALETGAKVLQDGGTALDAVEATIRLMEDDPHFNAGRGAVFTAAGRNELDSSIMDGATLNAGAVAGITRVRHPITAARAVMEKSSHVMLSGEGAEAFAMEQGLEIVDPVILLHRKKMAGIRDDAEGTRESHSCKTTRGAEAARLDSG